MNLLNLVKGNIKINNTSFNKNKWITLNIKNIINRKIEKTSGLIISFKKKKTRPIIKILKKFNNIKVVTNIKLDSPNIISYKIVKNISNN